MPVSIDQFQGDLITSTLMSAADVEEVLAALRGVSPPQNSEELGQLLVKLEKLTRFQVQQIAAGYGSSLVLGNYVILDKLGQGGMGVVFKAQHRRMKRVVAIKVLSPNITETPEALRRFQREVEAVAKLENANIVTAYDADEANGTHFLVMQYVEGADLAALVRRQGPLTVEQGLNCVLQAAQGLAYAHDRGVVHRDIKPSNLLLDRQGTLKILDMGLARLDAAGQDPIVENGLTDTGQIMGTIDYMAPEQALDTRTADARSDIYSLGATLWFLLTGRPVYEADTAMKKLMAHQNDPIPSLQQACPRVTAELDLIFAKMISKSREGRYQSMTEVIDDLKRGWIMSSGESPSKIDFRSAGELTQLIGGSESSLPTLLTTNKSNDNPVVAPGSRQTETMNSDTIKIDSRMPPLLISFKGAEVPAHIDPISAPRHGTVSWVTLGVGMVGLLTATIVYFAPVKVGFSPAKEELVEKTVSDPQTNVPTSKPNDQPVTQQLPPITSYGQSPEPPAFAVAPFDTAQANAHEVAWAKYSGIPVEFTDDFDVTYRLIPPGEFLMGSTEDEIAAAEKESSEFWVKNLFIKDQGPQHHVRLTRPYYLATQALTNRQFKKFVAVMGLKWEALDPEYQKRHFGHSGELDDAQTAGISWRMADDCLRWMSKESRANYRFPTEAEWEYACRAGTTTLYGDGDGPAGGRPVSDQTKAYIVDPTVNPFGLIGMYGTNWDWCLDFAGNFEGLSEIDPLQTNVNAFGFRVLRGGSYQGIAQFPAAWRFFDAAEATNPGNSLRPLREIPDRRLTDDRSRSEMRPVPPVATAPFDRQSAKKLQQEWSGYLETPIEHTNSIGMELR